MMTPVSRNTMKTVTNPNLSAKTTTPFSAGDLLKSNILFIITLPPPSQAIKIIFCVQNLLF